MHISRLPITAAALFTLAIVPMSLLARPTVPLETPQACQVINQQDINNTAHTSPAETLQKLSPSPMNCTRPPPNSTSLSPFDQRILDIHNHERALVGAAPLRWNPVLAQHATDYAQVLARTGQLTHAPLNGRGIERENLQKGLIGWSPDYFIRDWRLEKTRFHYGLFPDVCDGDWSQCAHYSQMIWPTTTDIGCGKAQGLGFDWFVCRYSPGGNKDGKPVGLGAAVAGGVGPASAAATPTLIHGATPTIAGIGRQSEPEPPVNVRMDQQWGSYHSFDISPSRDSPAPRRFSDYARQATNYIQNAPEFSYRNRQDYLAVAVLTDVLLTGGPNYPFAPAPPDPLSVWINIQPPTPDLDLVKDITSNPNFDPTDVITPTDVLDPM